MTLSSASTTVLQSHSSSLCGVSNARLLSFVCHSLLDAAGQMLELFLLRASFLGCLCPKLFHLFVVEEFVISAIGDSISFFFLPTNTTRVTAPTKSET